jgi:hypothetical protein
LLHCFIYTQVGTYGKYTAEEARLCDWINPVLYVLFRMFFRHSNALGAMSPAQHIEQAIGDISTLLFSKGYRSAFSIVQPRELAFSQPRPLSHCLQAFYQQWAQAGDRKPVIVLGKRIHHSGGPGDIEAHLTLYYDRVKGFRLQAAVFTAHATQATRRYTLAFNHQLPDVAQVPGLFPADVRQKRRRL